MSSSTLKLVYTLGVLVAGGILAYCYLRKPAYRRDRRGDTVGGCRPWRQLGGAISLVLAVMFALGAYAVDVRNHPWASMVYWTAIMGMALWLCALAMKDIWYTREMVARRRSATSDREHDPRAAWLADKEADA
ncbi:MAG: hypothetical protein ACE5HE_01670 [Phycisphaerae bacterium]